MYDKPGVVVAGVVGFGVVGFGVDGFGVDGRGVEGLGVVGLGVVAGKCESTANYIQFSGTQDLNICNGKNMMCFIFESLKRFYSL